MVFLFVSIVNQFFTLSAIASEVVRQRRRLESDFGAIGQPQHHFMNAGDLRRLDAPRHVIEECCIGICSRPACRPTCILHVLRQVRALGKEPVLGPSGPDSGAQVE
ncbi:hypothetical protein [Bradyrhizobium sp. WSM2793]|uniref:hypothetical protein n=1 Tax=Bradyrhizobium sp. WSM2793 TaxID=1038866 RepID=UPI0012F92A5B|nr:hypothetical protein [Bradyrhizobium sp. WSM2793]